MRIYPAIHYTMGGLWVDYNLMSTVPGLFVLGEANFSDHGANRLGASALMQGLADGYFVIPYTIGHYLASTPLPKVTTDHDAFKEAADNVQQRINRAARRSRAARAIREIHRELGTHPVGRRRHGAHRGEPEHALARIPRLRDEFWQNVSVPGRRTTSTRASNTPAAWPTTSSSPNCWRSTRCTANRAAATSARIDERAPCSDCIDLVT